MATKKSAIVGFSVNAEIVQIYDRMTVQEKGRLQSIVPYLCGTSANVARAINMLGQYSKVLALTGIDNDFESHVLRFALQKYTIPYHEFPILNHSHISILPIDNIPNPQVFGLKGDIEKSKIEETVDKIKEEVGEWRIGTGARPEELLLLKALFNEHAGYRSLNPRQELIGDKNNFLDILKSTDLLIMNHSEYDACKTTSPADLHQYGPSLVIVTQNRFGGMFSKNGVEPERFDSCNEYLDSNTKICGPGAGDWFHASFIVRCMELGKSINTLSIEEVRDCINFATRVSGKKITMQGAANGPTQNDL